MFYSALRTSFSRFITLVTICFLAACGSGGGGSEPTNFSAEGQDDSSSGSPSDSIGKVVFCATPNPDNNTMGILSASFGKALRDRTSTKADTAADIPVYFHVITKGDAFEDGNVPDEMIDEQIDVLNRAYSGETGGIPTPFRFHLAGIDRVNNPDWHLMSPGSDSELRAKETLRTGDAAAMNVFLCDIQETREIGEGTKGVILGYTTIPVLNLIIPQYDGVVMNFRALPGGPLTHYSTGNVLVHEAGHWLGLLHTFMGECDGFFDDLVSDTPREMIPAQGQFCPVDRDSCPVLEGADPVHNHMTYTGDECRSEFTSGQISFMKFNVSLFRGMSLW